MIMKPKRIVGVICAMLLGATACGWAELCSKCKDKMFTQEIGKCVNCGSITTSGAFKLCSGCSAKLGECEHCRAALNPATKAPALKSRHAATPAG